MRTSESKELAIYNDALRVPENVLELTTYAGEQVANKLYPSSPTWHQKAKNCLYQRLVKQPPMLSCFMLSMRWNQPLPASDMGIQNNQFQAVTSLERSLRFNIKRLPLKWDHHSIFEEETACFKKVFGSLRFSIALMNLPLKDWSPCCIALMLGSRYNANIKGGVLALPLFG